MRAQGNILFQFHVVAENGRWMKSLGMFGGNLYVFLDDADKSEVWVFDLYQRASPLPDFLRNDDRGSLAALKEGQVLAVADEGKLTRPGLFNTIDAGDLNRRIADDGAADEFGYLTYRLFHITTPGTRPEGCDRPSLVPFCYAISHSR